jgi:asparagine synthase (glutamine-hydrolysing)
VSELLGEPRADASAIPTWYVSRSARRHVVVALSGDGCDETFAGYVFRYVPHALEASARQWMPDAFAPAAGWLGARWPRRPGLPRPLRLGTLLENLSHDPATAYYADLAFLKPAETRLLMGASPERDPARSPVFAAVTDPYRRCASTDPVQRAEYADLKVYMPNDPLVKVDRMSMAHGLEIRCPLLDRRMVELAFRIPASQKQRGGRGKVLLRELARRRLPGALWQLPKRGFTAPIGEWIAGPHGNRFRDEVLRPHAAIGTHLDLGDLKRRFEDHRAGRADNGYTLWAAWVLERWFRQMDRGRNDVDRLEPALTTVASRPGASSLSASSGRA